MPRAPGPPPSAARQHPRTGGAGHAKARTARPRQRRAIECASHGSEPSGEAVRVAVAGPPTGRLAATAREAAGSGPTDRPRDRSTEPSSCAQREPRSRRRRRQRELVTGVACGAGGAGVGSLASMATRSPAPPRPSGRAGPGLPPRAARARPRPRGAVGLDAHPCPSRARRPARAGRVPRRCPGCSRVSRAAAAVVWLGIGHVVGGAVRRLGRGARDLDPAHRRDGLGLALVGARDPRRVLRLVGRHRPASAASSARWSPARWAASTGSLPFLLLGLAWRVLRQPDESAATGRVTIGWGAIVLAGVRARPRRRTARRCPPTAPRRCSRAAAGSAGSPPPRSSPPPTRSSRACCSSCSPSFGVLVVTATPVAAVPERLRYAARPPPRRARRGAEARRDRRAPTTAPQSPQGSADAAAADDAGLGVLAGDVAFETPLVAEAPRQAPPPLAPRTTSTLSRAGRPRDEHPRRRVDPDDLSTVIVDLTSGAIVTVAGEAAPTRCRRRPSTRRAARRSRATSPTTCRRAEALKPGAVHKPTSKASDAVVALAHRGARAVRHRRAGHRLLAAARRSRATRSSSGRP